MWTDCLTSLDFSSINSLAEVVGMFAGGFSGFWTQICVKEIAQYNLVLTWGDLFLALHSMCRRHQEKHPVLIVRCQRREQGIPQCSDRGYGQWSYTLLVIWGWIACRNPRCINPERRDVLNFAWLHQQIGEIPIWPCSTYEFVPAFWWPDNSS